MVSAGEMTSLDSGLPESVFSVGLSDPRTYKDEIQKSSGVEVNAGEGILRSGRRCLVLKPGHILNT